MSTPELPTIDELKEAFPSATGLSVNIHLTCAGLILGTTDFRIRWDGERFVCRYGDGRGRSGIHATDWRLAILNAVQYARARYDWQAKEAHNHIKALDEATKEIQHD